MKILKEINFLNLCWIRHSSFNLSFYMQLDYYCISSTSNIITTQPGYFLFRNGARSAKTGCIDLRISKETYLNVQLTLYLIKIYIL